MDCYNCENVKLDKNNVCVKCKLKLCSYCEERMFNHYEERMCDLFEVIFLLRLDSLPSKSVLVIVFACANLALKILAAKVLNSGVVA